ncbi:MAG: ATP-dependent Clp protease ATP-binding subunit [Prevotella sp.]
MFKSDFSDNVSQIITYGCEEAARLYNRVLHVEHLMLGILKQKDNEVKKLLKHINVDVDTLKQQLETEPTDYDTSNMSKDPKQVEFGDDANNLLRLSVLEARLQHTSTVNEMHLLLAILHDTVNNRAKIALQNQHVDYEQVLMMLRKDNEQKETKRKAPDMEYDLPDDEDEFSNIMEPGNNSPKTTADKDNKEKGTPVTDKFGVDLTKAAAEGKLDPVVGRKAEIMRVMEILGRRKKNNPILIGEPGVGKSAIVEGLAQLIAGRNCLPQFENKRIVNLDLTGLVAGTKYRGQFEERIKALINELEKNPQIVLFIDEIHTIIGAGSTPGSMDAANILKPALARGTIQCIGATTIDEYRKSIEKDGALERRFQKVMVEPTTQDETLQILHNIKSRYEHHHHVSYSDEALQACVNLTERYINERHFPDKAIDALDEVGSHVHLQHFQTPKSVVELDRQLARVKDLKEEAVRNQNFELAAAYRDRQTALEQKRKMEMENWLKESSKTQQQISESEVTQVVSVMSGIPVQRIETSEMERLRTMGDTLKAAVIGQDKAIETTVKAIRRNRIGLREPNRPIGVFMFLGPTGVGKTYLAKKLAEQLFGSSDALIRVDMSEFTESFNVSKLVGAPPGYVGYDEGGQLTERVRRHPYSIVLLDELEKAHSNVFNLLLQVLDEGRLTDGNGRMVDFRNTIIIMTSNAGTRQLKDFGRGIGFNTSEAGLLGTQDREHANSIIRKALSKQFSPEFLNRMDEIITFDQLDLDAIKRIVDLELRGLYQRMGNMGYQLQITDEAKEFVATKGYDVQFGVRPLKRAIQTYLEDELCDRIVNEELQKGEVTIGVAEGKITVSNHSCESMVDNEHNED